MLSGLQPQWLRLPRFLQGSEMSEDHDERRLEQIARDVRSTHEMVINLHQRANKSDERFEMLHKEHMALVSRVETVNNHVLLVERLSEARQAQNDVVHANGAELMKRVEGKIDNHVVRFDKHAETEEAERGRVFLGIILTLMTALAGLATLLYGRVVA
jgi:hypothetical protein